jgi:hypothetical protein
MIKRPLIAVAVIGALMMALANESTAQRKGVVRIGNAAIRASGPVGPDPVTVGITVPVTARRATVRSVQVHAVLRNTNAQSQPAALRHRPRKRGWVGRVPIPRNTSASATTADVWAVARTSVGVVRKKVGTVRVRGANIDPNQPPPPPDI